MGTRRLDSLTDLIRHQLMLKVECRCGRVVIMDPNQLLEQCQARRAPKALMALSRQLKCARCGRRPWVCEPM